MFNCVEKLTRRLPLFLEGINQPYGKVTETLFIKTLRRKQSHSPFIAQPIRGLEVCNIVFISSKTYINSFKLYSECALVSTIILMVPVKFLHCSDEFFFYILVNEKKTFLIWFKLKYFNSRRKLNQMNFFSLLLYMIFLFKGQLWVPKHWKKI